MTYRAWNLKPLDRAALRELTQAIAEQATEELEYNAQNDEPWSKQKYAAALAAQQKENALLAGVLTARGITDPTEALTLLAGEEELSDPSLLTDMDKACERIWRAIDEGETIVVFGDYDVDGVTATALLYQHLKGMGATVKCMLPSREGDGYGLSRNAIRSIHDKGCKLIVTVDNGISAVEEADYAAELGIDLIITDHHLPPETLPKAIAVVDPRREDDTSPFKGLCGAGVAFKLCAALDGCPPEEMLEYCGDLAAVGTVADVMPLTGENRTIVKAGLRQLQNTDRPGFCALLEEVGLAGKPVTAENISYAIAPRINAAGRMDSAVTALQLVLCEDEDRAVELAHKLSDINIQRQETEMEIVKAAQELLDAEPERLEDRVILLWGRDWHPGVIGIVASRLVEKTGRPVIVVSVDEHGEGKGSGRSVQGFNLHECIASCADILLRFGGHAMAAGLSVREEDLQTLRQRLNDWAARECPVLRTPPLECDLSVHLDRLTVESVRRLDMLYAMLVPSANDAASVLAVDTSGSLAAFAAQMNVRASQLGCTATHFTCPHGLYDGGNYSTARDMAKIALACYADPTYRQIADTMSYKLPATNVHPARTVTTTNKLLQPGGGYYRSYAHGMKTGFTTQAGRCFVTFARQDGHTYGLVILGSNSQNIFREAAELFDWAFTSPELHPAPAEPKVEPEKHGLSAFWHKVFG